MKWTCQFVGLLLGQETCTCLQHVHFRELEHPRNDQTLQLIQALLVAMLSHQERRRFPLQMIWDPSHLDREFYIQLLSHQKVLVTIFESMAVFRLEWGCRSSVMPQRGALVRRVQRVQDRRE